MKGWLMLIGAAVLLIVLPIVALIEFFGPVWKLVARFILGALLIVALIGSGLFGYICFKAQARKWGAGLFVIVLLCVIAIYWLVMERLPFL